MLSAIFIPADEQEPLRLEEFEADDLDARQQLVGGSFEVFRLEGPAADLYVKKDGKLMVMPINRRATLVLWAHNHPFRGQDVIAGDAFILGNPDDEDNATTAPQELIDLLLHTERYRVLVRNQGEEQFYGTLRTFDSWVEAYSYGIQLTWRLSQIVDFRVVGEERDTEANDPQPS